MQIINHANQAREDWREGVTTVMLVSAVTGGYKDIVKLLLDNGANIAPTKLDDMPIVSYAIHPTENAPEKEATYVEIMELLI